MNLSQSAKHSFNTVRRAAILPVARVAGALGPRRKIYDAFLFNQELDLLEARLSYLYPVVDCFVIGESALNFAGQPKPLHYADNRKRFEKYADKIRHVVIPAPSAEQYDASLMDPTLKSSEYYHRRALIAGLHDARDEDVVLYSDADEIPRQAALETLVGLLRLGHPAAMFVMNWHLLYLNVMATTYVQGGERCCWLGTIGTTSHQLKTSFAADFNQLWKFRWGDLRQVLIRTPHGGWHFSFFGGVERVRQKQRDASFKLNDPQEIPGLLRKEFVGVKFDFFDEKKLIPNELTSHLGSVWGMTKREEDFIREISASAQG